MLRLLREHAGGNRGPAVSADLAAAMVDFADALELAPSRSVPLDARADAVVIFETQYKMRYGVEELPPLQILADARHVLASLKVKVKFTVHKCLPHHRRD